MRLARRTRRLGMIGSAVCVAVVLPLALSTAAHGATRTAESSEPPVTVTSIGVGQVIEATIDRPGEIDHYSFVAPADGDYLFDVFDSSLPLGPLSAWGCCRFDMGGFDVGGPSATTTVASVQVPGEAGHQYDLAVMAPPADEGSDDRTGSYRVRILPSNANGAERDSAGEPNGSPEIAQPIPVGEWFAGEVTPAPSHLFERFTDRDVLSFPTRPQEFLTLRTRSTTSKTHSLPHWMGQEQQWDGTSGSGWARGTGEPGQITITGGEYGAYEVCVETWDAACIGGLQRLAGPNRFSTSAQISSTFPTRVPVAVIATGTDFPDALGGATLAARLGGPVILVPKVGIPKAVADELRRLNPRRLIVLGGLGAVSDETYYGLLDTLPMYFSDTLTRIAGADRYETAANIARWTPSSEVVYVATGLDYPDALAGAALAGRTRSPILLTRPHGLDPTTIQAIQGMRPQRIVVLGGESRVSDTVVSQLTSLVAVDGSVTRIAGSNRFETAALLAAEFPAPVGHAFVATGQQFPDALSGAGRAVWTGGPMLLVPGTSIPSSADTQLRRLRPEAITVVGGTGAVSGGVQNSLAHYLR